MMVGKQWRARISHAIISLFWATPALQGYWDSSQPWPNTPTEDLACWQMWKGGLQRFHIPDPWDFGYLDTLLLLFLHQSQRLCLGVICTHLLNIVPFAPSEGHFSPWGQQLFSGPWLRALRELCGMLELSPSLPQLHLCFTKLSFTIILISP